MGNLAKIISLCRLVDKEKHDVILLYKTMGVGYYLMDELCKIIKAWEFVAIDAVGQLGGILFGWNSSFQLINSFSVFSGIYTNMWSKVFNQSYWIINLYGPYEER